MLLARDNPYTSDRILRLRYRPQTASWDDLYSRLHALNHRAAIVGPEGTGKSTLLEDLEPHLSDKGFRTHRLRLNLENRRPPTEFWSQTFGQQDILLLDGAEVLSRPLWWRLRLQTRASGLLITAHRPGFLPTLLETATSPQLLNELLGELGQTIPDAELLLHSCRGNIREAFRQLYLRASEGK